MSSGARGEMRIRGPLEGVTGALEKRRGREVTRYCDTGVFNFECLF